MKSQFPKPKKLKNFEPLNMSLSVALNNLSFAVPFCIFGFFPSMEYLGWCTSRHQIECCWEFSPSQFAAAWVSFLLCYLSSHQYNLVQ